MRKEAAELNTAGKYEPGLRENGIPEDVLQKLLPGDDVIELQEPVVGGGLGYRFVKRAFDIVTCGCALIVLAIPMAVIAVKIKRESPGPAIYSQERVGKDGEPFKVYKFRSMYVDAESRGAQWAQGDDPRVTPFGRVMRKTRLDEIPQFWNIVKGDMSLIGPRPERPAFCEEFEKRIHGWGYRTKVRPGRPGVVRALHGCGPRPAQLNRRDRGRGAPRAGGPFDGSGGSHRQGGSAPEALRGVFGLGRGVHGADAPGRSVQELAGACRDL